MTIDETAAARAIDTFLRALGHDTDGGDLAGTGARVASLYANELLDGYRTSPHDLLGEALPSEADAPLVVVRRLSTHVVCPHHLTLGAGDGAVAYLPGAHVLGLGTLARLVDAITHRLVLQESACREVARVLVDVFGAHGAACRLAMRHGCLEHHGARKRGAVVETLAFAGTFSSSAPDRELVSRALAGPRASSRARRKTGRD